jgi:hypothetical protein
MNKGKSLNMSEEFADLDFNSSRLEKRFVRTMETLSKRPDKSLWLASANRAEAKAIYRMLGNEDFDREEILRTHRNATIKRMAEYGGTILAVQDTTSLNYNTHVKTEGIGYIGDKTLGVNIHSCLAVTRDGLVLGVLDQRSYNREQAKDDSGNHENKKTRPIEEKESFRWIQTLEQSLTSIENSVKVLTVCDREGDMYELFDAAASHDWLFLIRIVQNRMTIENKRILDDIQKTACLGRAVRIISRDSRRNLKEREAILQIRYASYAIKRPQIRNTNKTLHDSIMLYVIYVKEEQKTPSDEPIEWFLATNEPIGSVQEAWEKVDQYMQRWKIERFHYVLKSGCKVEKLQERSIEKTTTLVLMYSLLAVFIMSMTYIARINPELPCSCMFEDDEWMVLYRTANKTKIAPAKPYSIADALVYLGQLGGPKTAPSDGPPGVKTVWIGLMNLQLLLLYRDFLS